MTILIPAYEPSETLIELIIQIKERCNYHIAIVDDGSGDDYIKIFNATRDLGCSVITHFMNRGKGQALKTGFSYLIDKGETEGVVTADCDGQHKVEDILRVANSIKHHKDCIVLGTRRFVGKVPLRSRLGNSITRVVFSFTSGTKVYDTQTGLRGFSPKMLAWLTTIPGDRFEYEMNMLLMAASAGYQFHELYINTIYLNENKSSHFRAIRDSIRIYLPIIKFSASSTSSAVLDFVLLMLIQHFTSNLLLSVVGARIFSSVFNYIINKNLVFSLNKSINYKAMPRYFLLVLGILLANYILIYTLTNNFGIPLILSKIFTETVLFLFSFWSQKKFVFV